MSSSDDVSKISVPRTKINVNFGDRVILNVDRADNEVVVLLNDTHVWSKKTEHNPQLNAQIELGELLERGMNYLNIVGIDWLAWYHYKFSLDVNGNSVTSPVKHRVRK